MAEPITASEPLVSAEQARIDPTDYAHALSLRLKDERALSQRLAAENAALTARLEAAERRAKADGWDECHRASLGGFDAANPYRTVVSEGDR